MTERGAGKGWRVEDGRNGRVEGCKGGIEMEVEEWRD